jgi:hypothetical protein
MSARIKGLLVVLLMPIFPSGLWAQQVRITVHIFTGNSINHGQLVSSWQDHSGLTTSTSQARKGLVLEKATVSADLGIPYANIVGFEGMPLKELGFDVRSQKVNGFSGEHCNSSPTVEVTLTNGTTYAFFCASGTHTAIQNTAWDRVRFTDGDAIPISCSGKGCVMEPWPGFRSGTAIVASPTSPNPSFATFMIIMFDGYDSPPDFSGVAYMDNIDLNGTLIGDGGTHAVR